MKKIIVAIASFFFICAPSLAQWQVPDHAVPIGRGSGTGFKSVGPCATGQTILGQGTSSDPICGSGSNLSAPKISRYSATSGTFTPDATATLIEVWLQAGGGGGSGVNAGNTIPYSQYGRIANPTAFGTLDYTATITNAAPGIITAIASNTSCNQPFYLTTTGSLPTGYTANTVYYVQCSNDGYPAPTANTFAGATSQFPAPLTCAVYAPFCQSPITTSSAGSGVHTLHLYRWVATPGNGGGIVGDQAVPGSYINCDSSGPAGYVQGYGLQGTTGDNVYGINIAAGSGGGSPFGPGATGGEAGVNNIGAGGSGANPTSTSSGGGGGAGGGWCYLSLRPTGTYPFLAGAGGPVGIAGLQTFTVTIANPGVFTATAHGFGPNALLTLTTTGALPPGLAVSTNYYVYGPSITNDTFELSATPNGTPIITSGSQSGVHTLHSGTAGGLGGNGQLVIKQSYGLN